MPINFKTPGLHHLALRVSNLEKAKEFYVGKLGFPIALEKPNLVVIVVGSHPIGLRGPEEQTPAGDQFNPFRVGLDHLAFGCETKEELVRVTAVLNEYAIENTGIKFDETLQKDYVCFKDPDRISWEFFMI